MKKFNEIMEDNNFRNVIDKTWINQFLYCMVEVHIVVCEISEDNYKLLGQSINHHKDITKTTEANVKLNDLELEIKLLKNKFIGLANLDTKLYPLPKK